MKGAVPFGASMLSVDALASTAGREEEQLLIFFLAIGLIASGVLAACLENVKSRKKVPIFVDVSLTVILLALASMFTMNHVYQGSSQISSASELAVALVFGSWPYSAFYFFVRYVAYKFRTQTY